MPPLETLLVFTIAAFIMNLSPGPSNLYVMSRSVAQGSTAGAIAACGLAVGSLAHVAAAAFGLSAVFVYSPVAYTVLKLLGAGYLIYLGLNYLFSKSEVPMAPRRVAKRTYPKILRESVLVEATNPKTALFFLAFLPQFVDIAAGPPAPQLLLLGFIVTLTAIPCDLLVAYSSSKISRWLLGRADARRIQEQISGTILIGLGFYVVFQERIKLF